MLKSLRDEDPIESELEDIEFQIKFWREVVREAKLTNHAGIIITCKEKLTALKQRKSVLNSKLPTTKFDFPTQSILEWHRTLHHEITYLPNTAVSNPESVLTIAKFYTQLLDYLANPKVSQRNSLCVFSGFIEGNIFGSLCKKHVGLFERIKINTGKLRNEKYYLPKNDLLSKR